MIGILDTAKRLQTVCEKAAWPYCFIGGLAVQRWGELRMTKDVDATIYTGLGNERPFIARLLKSFTPRGDDAAGFD